MEAAQDGQQPPTYHTHRAHAHTPCSAARERVEGHQCDDDEERPFALKLELSTGRLSATARLTHCVEIVIGFSPIPIH